MFTYDKENIMEFVVALLIAIILLIGWGFYKMISDLFGTDKDTRKARLKQATEVIDTNITYKNAESLHQSQYLQHPSQYQKSTPKTPQNPKNLVRKKW